MTNHPGQFWGSVVILCSMLLCQVTFADSKNGIRMWRDRNGILNISNMSLAAGKAGITIGNKEKNRAIVATPAAVATPNERTRYTNIYTYTDKVGVKHFTNMPSGNQHYQLALRASFAGLTPQLDFATVQHSAYDGIVAEAARTYQVDQSLVRAMIHAESAFNPSAISPKGAVGLMQLMPDTANRYGVRDAFNPNDNIHGGVRYLRDLLKMFDNNLTLAIAAYNAGENAVTRYGGVPPYTETTNYVQRVLSLHNRYQNQNHTINN